MRLKILFLIKRRQDIFDVVGLPSVKSLRNEASSKCPSVILITPLAVGGT